MTVVGTADQSQIRASGALNQQIAGRLREAADLLEQVVAMDRKYNLPKLQENIGRLDALRVRLAEGARA